MRCHLCLSGMLLCLLSGTLGAVGVKAAQEARPEAESTGFLFPDDRCGALLKATLPPPVGRVPVAEHARAPRRRLSSLELESPRLPLALTLVEAPRLPIEGRRSLLRPRLVTEEAAFGLRRELDVPELVWFYAPDKTKLPSVDVNLAPPLPYLAQPLPDRASLADATAEASAEAALAAPLPRREKPAPFLKLSVPDPFENRRPLRVPLPEEDSTPAAARPATPKP